MSNVVNLHKESHLKLSMGIFYVENPAYPFLLQLFEINTQTRESTIVFRLPMTEESLKELEFSINGILNMKAKDDVQNL